MEVSRQFGRWLMPGTEATAMKPWTFGLAVLLLISAAGAFVAPGGPATDASLLSAGDTAWLLTASAMVLLMTPGLSFFYGGMVRPKNVISTMLQSFIAMAVISLLWVTVGFSLAFGDSIGGEGFGLVGNPATFFLFKDVGGSPNPAFAATIPFALFAMFQMKFAIITPALVTGSFAERVRFSAYLLFMLLFAVLVYAPLAHWTWHPNGFLRNWGVLDFAGGTVVHMSAGVAALAGAIALGRRKDYAAGMAHPPANIPYVLIGTGLLWFGWFGFNAGSSLAANDIAVSAFMTTNTASAAAALGWVFFDGIRGRKPSALGACIGAVVGLVAITPAAGFVSVGSAIAIGTFAAMTCNIVAHWRSKSALDDTLDVFPCHGVGGMFGMLATGIFASKAVNPAGADGLLYGGTKLFLMHLLAMVIVCGYTFVVSYGIFKLVGLIVPLRVTADDEQEGLDRSQHGESIIATEAQLGLAGGE
jgi:Amt family ammonium transporter